MIISDFSDSECFRECRGSDEKSSFFRRFCFKNFKSSTDAGPVFRRSLTQGRGFDYQRLGPHPGGEEVFLKNLLPNFWNRLKFACAVSTTLDRIQSPPGRQPPNPCKENQEFTLSMQRSQCNAEGWWWYWGFFQNSSIFRNWRPGSKENQRRGATRIETCEARIERCDGQNWKMNSVGGARLLSRCLDGQFRVTRIERNQNWKMPGLKDELRTQLSMPL